MKKNFSFLLLKKCFLIVSFFCLISTVVSAQAVQITINTAVNKKKVSPYIYGSNNSLDKPAQFYKDVGLRFARMNGGNNASAYNWQAKLTVHPDWYNNVYASDWDAQAQKISTTFPDMQGMFAFQLLGRVAANTNNNFNDWGYNQAQYWSGVGQNLAGGGTPDPSGGSKALIEGNPDLFSKPWPADSSVGILNHWFGAGGKGYNKDQFVYWNMDNEVDIWSGTHDWVMPKQLSASSFVDRYIELAKKAKALYPGIKLCGPVTTSEWQWYKWSNESLYINGRYYSWIEYFIKRLGDEYKATGIKLVDVIDIHNYPFYNNETEALQGHRIYYDTTYDYPGSNGIKTSTGGWDASLTKQYIFKRIDGWLTEHFGSNHGITTGVSEWGTMTTSNPSLESVVYASHLGTFANNGVELFSPWNWSVGMWETLHLFSRYAKEYSVSSTSSLENTVSAYTTVNQAEDAMTVIIVNRDMNASRTVTVNISNFSAQNGTAETQQISGLPATETFVSHTNNALKKSSVNVASNSFTITVPALSTTAVSLTKNVATVNYVTIKNRAKGLLMDGMGRPYNTSVGQQNNSGSNTQQWSIETIGNYVMIKNKATGLYIDGMGRTASPSDSGQWGYSASDAQQWKQENYSGYVKFKNKLTGLYLDGLGKSATTSNLDLGQWKSSNSTNQHWIINNVSSTQTAKTTKSDTVAAITDTQEIVNTEVQMNFYPNPFVDVLKLEVSNFKGQLQIEVVNMLGQVMESIKTDTISSPISLGKSLKSGFYIVRVNGKNVSKSFKILKN